MVEKHMVSISNLVKKYPSGQEALKGVNLEVNANEILALIGPSGAGKSTLIRCVNRLVEPTSGKIIINGIDVCTLGYKALRMQRRKIGMIFQEYALVDRLTVMENVLSGQLGYTGTFKSIFRKFPPDVVDSAIKLLERVGLLDYFDSRADQLSGGHRQRVGIARALIQRPDLLLVDEPTASLDPKTARQIMRLIVELVIEYKLAVIINIHDVQLAQMFAQRIVGLRDGIVVYDGTPDQVDNSVLTEIYGEEDWDQGKKRHAQEEDDDEDDDIDQVE